MNARPNRIGALALGLCAIVSLVLGPSIVPSDALAAVDCTSTTHDEDLDGISDKHECDGFTPFPSLTNIARVPRCTGTPAPGAARNACLDPNSKDIFVVLVTPANSILAGIVEPFELLYQPRVASGNGSTINGLGLGVHVFTSSTLLSTSQKTLISGFPQRAIQVSESLNPNSPISGKMDLYGTPTFCAGRGCVQLADGVVWTQRIKNQVNGIYGFDNPAVWSLFIKRTLAHEISHAMALKAQYDDRYGGNHDPDTANVIMQQNVTYSGSGANAVFNIGVDYAAGDNDCERKISVTKQGLATCVPF